MIYCQILLMLATAVLAMSYPRCDRGSNQYNGFVAESDGLVIRFAAAVVSLVFLWLCGAFSQIISPPWGSP